MREKQHFASNLHWNWWIDLNFLVDTFEIKFLLFATLCLSVWVCNVYRYVAGQLHQRHYATKWISTSTWHGSAHFFFRILFISNHFSNWASTRMYHVPVSFRNWSQQWNRRQLYRLQRHCDASSLQLWELDWLSLVHNQFPNVVLHQSIFWCLHQSMRSARDPIRDALSTNKIAVSSNRWPKQLSCIWALWVAVHGLTRHENTKYKRKNGN